MKKIQPGDRLLCYLVGAKRWVAVLRVTGTPYRAHEPKIWQGDDFPCRVEVEVEVQLSPTGVPVVETLADLSITEKIKEGKSASWGVYFQGSPSRWSDEDGAVVVAAIQHAVTDPVERPLPRQALRRAKPRPVDTGTDLGLVTVPEDLPGPDEDAPELPVSPPTELNTRGSGAPPQARTCYGARRVRLRRPQPDMAGEGPQKHARVRRSFRRPSMRRRTELSNRLMFCGSTTIPSRRPSRSNGRRSTAGCYG